MFSKITVGVLAFHGAFVEHERSIKKAFEAIVGVDSVQGMRVVLETVLVKRSEQVPDLDGLIIPGGESPVMSKFLGDRGFLEVLRKWMEGKDGMKPMIWGTCAGLILLANNVKQAKGGQLMIGGMDISTNRNIFMRQNGCFEQPIKLLNDDLRQGVNSQSPEYHGVFINPPVIDSINADSVEIIAEYDDNGTTRPIAVKQNNMIASSFHPELTDDFRWHEYFLRRIMDSRG